MPWHVVKVGGSLLDDELLPARLTAWLEERPACERILLLVGGGRLVDALRGYDRIHALPTEAAHWMAIDLLDVTSDILGTRLVGISRVSHLEELVDRPDRIARLAPAEFLRNQEQFAPGRPLAAGWHVTSDAIAARVAEAIGATRLTLLKSAPWPDGIAEQDWTVAAEVGYVDADFPLRVAAISTTAIDFRNFQAGDSSIGLA